MVNPMPELTEDMVKNLILTWYPVPFNDHLPIEQIEVLFAPAMLR